MTSMISPELQRLADEVRDWSVRELRPLARRSDAQHAPMDEAYAAFANAPFTGSPLSGQIVIDPARGVPEGRYQAGTVVIENGVYGDMLFMSAAPGGGIGGKVVELIGTPEQVDRWTGGLARGEFRYSGFGLTEPGVGSDAASLRTTARLEGDQWIIDGTKMFCSGGAISDFIIVFATIDRSLGHRGIRAFVVESDRAGYTVAKPNEDKLGCRAMFTSELVFDSVAVPLDHCLGIPEQQPRSFGTALSALNTTRHQVASMACGIAAAALDELRPLVQKNSSFMTTARQERIAADLAAMEAAIDRGRLMARRAAWRIDNGLSFDRESAMAKAYSPPLAERVCLRALQMLGSDGISPELPFEKWYRDVKILDIWEGTGQIQRRSVGRSLFRMAAPKN